MLYLKSVEAGGGGPAEGAWLAERVILASSPRPLASAGPYTFELWLSIGP